MSGARPAGTTCMPDTAGRGGPPTEGERVGLWTAAAVAALYHSPGPHLHSVSTGLGRAAKGHAAPQQQLVRGRTCLLVGKCAPQLPSACSKGGRCVSRRWVHPCDQLFLSARGHYCCRSSWHTEPRLAPADPHQHSLHALGSCGRQLQSHRARCRAKAAAAVLHSLSFLPNPTSAPPRCWHEE